MLVAATLAATLLAAEPFGTLTCAALSRQDLRQMWRHSAHGHHAVWCANRKSGELVGAVLTASGRIVGLLVGAYDTSAACANLVFPDGAIVRNCPS